jgi:hypothetical protein
VAATPEASKQTTNKKDVTSDLIVQVTESFISTDDQSNTSFTFVGEKAMRNDDDDDGVIKSPVAGRNEDGRRAPPEELSPKTRRQLVLPPPVNEDDVTDPGCQVEMVLNASAIPSNRRGPKKVARRKKPNAEASQGCPAPHRLPPSPTPPPPADTERKERQKLMRKQQQQHDQSIRPLASSQLRVLSDPQRDTTTSTNSNDNRSWRQRYRESKFKMGGGRPPVGLPPPPSSSPTKNQHLSVFGRRRLKSLNGHLMQLQRNDSMTPAVPDILSSSSTILSEFRSPTE